MKTGRKPRGQIVAKTNHGWPLAMFERMDKEQRRELEITRLSQEGNTTG
jgi:hypothetical protein